MGIAKSNLPQQFFLEELEKLSPRASLSTNNDLEIIENILRSQKNTSEVDAELARQLSEFEARSSLKKVCDDPRINMAELLANLPPINVDDYSTNLANSRLIDTKSLLHYKIMATAEYNQFPGISEEEHSKLKELFDPQIVLRNASNEADHATVNNKSELASSYESGTCIRRTVNNKSVLASSASTVYDSGTVRIVPSSSSMIAKDPGIHNVGPVVKTDDLIATQSNIKQSLRVLKVKVEDIEPTISRGDLKPGQ